MNYKIGNAKIVYLNNISIKKVKNMKSILIKDTTKEERIALIREWIPDDDGLEDDGGIDLWEMYDAYIKGEKEIAEINMEFHAGFYEEEDTKQAPGCGQGSSRR
jgi:hypothetical protein